MFKLYEVIQFYQTLINYFVNRGNIYEIYS